MTVHSFFSSSTLRRGALIAAVSVGALAFGAGEASAQWRRHYYRGGWGPGAVAAGVVGGLAVGALAAGAYPYYGPAYGPAPVYAGPRCWIEPEDSWNGYRWVRRNVRVCD